MADLTSGTGAVVLGTGLGVLLADWLANLALPILVSGIVMHAWGMYDKHRVEREAGEPESSWAAALYWVCWLILAGMLVWVLIR